MIKPIIVTIYGNVSTGKSAWAQAIKSMAKKKGKTAMVFDHELFTFDKKITKKLIDIHSYIERENPDFSIIVIGTGLNRKPEFSIEVGGELTSAMRLFDLIFNDL